MRRHIACWLLSLVAVTAPAVCQAAVQVPPGFIDDVVTAGLSEPNSMAFLPDWRILVTEQRTGQIRMIVGASFATQDPIHIITDVNSGGYEQGLQGIAVDPAWPQRPYVYTYYTSTDGFCKLVRFTASGDLDNPVGQLLTLSNPVDLIDDIRDQHITHNGGCVRFGPDGMLYLSLGDDDVPCDAADSTTLRGCILRLRVNDLEEHINGRVTRDLITPYDNPFSTPDSNARLVWAYGMRNPWRYHIDPYSGKIYSADVGLVTYEEINEILPGDFLGWPYREGPQLMPRASCPEPGGNGANSYKPAVVSMLRDPDILVAISSAGVYRPVLGASHNWPPESYDGDYFYGEYYTGDLYRLKEIKGVWIPAPQVLGQPDSLRWAKGLYSAVDFLVGPEGSLYWLAQYDSTLFGPTGSLQRIRNIGATTSAPIDPALSARIYFTAYPNPSAALAQLAFRLPRATHVRLELFDLEGRRIVQLKDGDGIAGENRLEWDGKDSFGRQVRPGMYLARIQFLGASKTIRLIRLE